MDYLKTSKGVEKVPAWIAKRLLSATPMYDLEQYVKNNIPKSRQAKALAKADYFFQQFIINNTKANEN